MDHDPRNLHPDSVNGEVLVISAYIRSLAHAQARVLAKLNDTSEVAEYERIKQDAENILDGLVARSKTKHR